MCNLYSMTAARQAVLSLFRVSDNRAEQFDGATAIFPGHRAPVVRMAADGARELVTTSWGFVLPQPGKAPRRVTNCRDDKCDSPFWRESLRERRCLVPATSFAEPRDVKPATWHWFGLTGGEARPLFAFAGLWRSWRGPVRKDGPIMEIDVFAFLTTTPNSVVARINHERMPVILGSVEAFDTWLGSDRAAAMALAREYPPEGMRELQGGLEKEDLLGALPAQGTLL